MLFSLVSFAYMAMLDFGEQFAQSIKEKTPTYFISLSKANTKVISNNNNNTSILLTLRTTTIRNNNCDDDDDDVLVFF